MKEAISKFDIMGIEFVRLDDLNELIRDMQRKTREHKENGYLIESEGQRIAADLALNHLRAILNKEKNFDGMLMKLFKTRIEREEREKAARDEKKPDVAKMKRVVESARAEIDKTQKAIDKAEKLIDEIDGDEKYVVFTVSDGKFQFYDGLVRYADIPTFIRKHTTKVDGLEWAVTSISDIDHATLFDSEDEAKAAIEQAREKAGTEAKWHIAKRRMFDDDGFRERVLAQEEEPKNHGEKPEKKCDKRCPGRYTVWYRDDGETTQHCMGFVRFEKSMPVFTNRPCNAMRFVWKWTAEKVAERCGEGFEVVDMFDQMTGEERLLRDIFHEDGMDGEDEEPEYSGDGTAAEDEDWDGDDE